MRRTADLIWLLVRLRWKTALRTYARDSSALMGAAIGLFVFGPAAFAAAASCRAEFARLDAAHAAPLLLVVLVAVQAVWLLLLLLPGAAGAGGGGLAALGQAVPASVLRPFPVRPWQVVLAGALGALFDLPLLFALPVLGAVAGRFGQGPLGAPMVVLLLAAFAFQTAALAQLIEQAWALFARRRRSTAWMGLLAALVVGVWFGLPSAFAAVTTKPQEEWLVRLRAATHRPAPAEAAPDAPLWAQVLPSGVAAQGVAAAERREWPAALGALALTAGLAGGAVFGAARLQQAAATREASGSSRRRVSRSAPAADSPTAATPWSQVRAAAVTEWLNLTRSPGAHLPLRWPATLLLTVFFGWMAPNLDPRFPYENMRDLAGMGGLLYVALWQMQLLTDRFGNEAGTASLLFSTPAPRARLLMGRNLALGALLLAVDGALVALMCASARAPHRIGPMLLWLPAVLAVLTAAGNVVSVLSPFPIPKKGERFAAEPDRSLMFLYPLLGAGAWLALWPARALLAALPAPAAWLLVFAYAAGLYALSPYVAARLLAGRELRLVRILDRDR